MIVKQRRSALFKLQNEIKMIYTAWANYSATGEGQTYMVLIMIAKDEDDLRKTFAEKFGSYMAIGMEHREGVYLDFPGNGFVITPALRNFTTKWKKDDDYPMLNYFSSFHFNYS
jgi:hypothetical protein